MSRDGGSEKVNWGWAQFVGIREDRDSEWVEIERGEGDEVTKRSGNHVAETEEYGW